ncbi:MAG: FKBP-type peptidyl-prolyl cis-trans isomerase [Bacteroidales bacterium]|nr:FKBP-type peptidyl-prolyl cis-trans isomerase [Bacteroidales bacterium]
MKSLTKVLSATAISALMLSSCGGQINKNEALKNDTDSLSYAFGSLMGYQYEKTVEELQKQYDIKLNYKAFLAGFQTSADMDTLHLKFKSPQEAQMYLQSVIGKYDQAKMAEQMNAEAKYFEENGKKEGVVSLESGLQYEILEEANGPKPEETDTVLCDYVGTLTDGTVFDSSIERGEPAKFPLNRVIPGWTELIQLMPKGSKWKLYIPSRLGYGPQGTPDGSIPPNSTLIFEVKLIDIMKGKPAGK